MNKAKAYRRLRKKQQHSVHDWSELIQTNDRPRLPLRDLTQLSIEEIQLTTASQLDLRMFGVRNFDTLKSVIEVDDLEGENKIDLTQCNTSLPNIDNVKQYSSSRLASRVTAKVDSLRRPGTTGNEYNSFTILQAKLDALILPNPQKRKASRSFSGSSSGFYGGKITNYRKNNSIMKQAVTKKPVESNTPRDTMIQFPIASKMRQLLTVEQIEQPAPTHLESSATLLGAANVEKKARVREFTNAAKFYFPSYTTQKEKNTKLNTSNDRPDNAKPLNDPSFITTGKKFASSYIPKPRSHLPKQVSFIDENNNTPLKRVQQFAPPLPPNVPPVVDPVSNKLPLTTKNLEMFNTLAMTSALSAPSEEECRTTCWIKERLHWNNEQYDAIPELDENIKSASPLDDDSSSSCTLE